MEESISYINLIGESSLVSEHLMWLMIGRTYLGKCWKSLKRSKLPIKGSESFGFNLMTVISHRQQTRGKEVCLTPPLMTSDSCH